MNPRLRILSLCTLMLLMAGCGNDKTSDSIIPSSTEESSIVMTTDKKDDTANTYGVLRKRERNIQH